MYPSQRRRLLFTLSIVLGGMLVAMFAAGYFVEQNALREESATVQRQLRLYAQALQQRIDRYRTLPQILTLDPDLRAAVDAPLSADQVERLNRKLERANNVTQSSTLTLINRDGIALAASNWRGARSNVGVDYAFRPYYQQALASGSGSFYGIGLTTGEPGYFLSQAIRDPAGQVQGVVVIKIALAALEREWLQTRTSCWPPTRTMWCSWPAARSGATACSPRSANVTGANCRPPASTPANACCRCSAA